MASPGFDASYSSGGIWVQCPWGIALGWECQIFLLSPRLPNAERPAGITLMSPGFPRAPPHGVLSGKPRRPRPPARRKLQRGGGRLSVRMSSSGSPDCDAREEWLHWTPQDLQRSRRTQWRIASSISSYPSIPGDVGLSKIRCAPRRRPSRFAGFDASYSSRGICVQCHRAALPLDGSAKNFSSLPYTQHRWLQMCPDSLKRNTVTTQDSRLAAFPQSARRFEVHPWIWIERVRVRLRQFEESSGAYFWLDRESWRPQRQWPLARYDCRFSQHDTGRRHSAGSGSQAGVPRSHTSPRPPSSRNEKGHLWDPALQVPLVLDRHHELPLDKPSEERSAGAPRRRPRGDAREGARGSELSFASPQRARAGFNSGTYKLRLE